MALDMITRRRAIEGIAGVAAYSLLTSRGFAASTLIDSQPLPQGSAVPANITVGGSSIGTIGPAFAGFSYEKSELVHPIFRASNRNLIGLFKLLGPSILRVGGDSSDKMVWNSKGRGQTWPQIAPSDVASLAAFVKATGWTCLYTVNLGGSANGSTSPELAADEVAYAAQVFGSSLYGIEIGNEPDAYSGPRRQYANNPLSLQAYEELWNQYRSAILARVPGVMVTGPAAGHLATWTIPFSKDQTKAKLSLLTDHYYAGRGHSQHGFTPAVLVTPDPLLISNLKLMHDAQQETGIPFRISETNSFTDDFPGTSNSYASSLWSLDYLFQCAQGGASGVNFHTAKSVSYTAIADDENNVLEVRPEYYGILFFTMAGRGPLYQTKVSAGSLDISAYAVKTSSGMNVVIVNKDPSQSLRASVQLPQNVSSANLFTLDQRSDGASSSNLSATSGVMIQGAAVGTDGRFTPGSPYQLGVRGSQVSCYVPSLSAVLIRTT